MFYLYTGVVKDVSERDGGESDHQAPEEERYENDHKWLAAANEYLVSSLHQDEVEVILLSRLAVRNCELFFHAAKTLGLRRLGCLRRGFSVLVFRFFLRIC